MACRARPRIRSTSSGSSRRTEWCARWSYAATTIGPRSPPSECPTRLGPSWARRSRWSPPPIGPRGPAVLCWPTSSSEQLLAEQLLSGRSRVRGCRERQGVGHVRRVDAVHPPGRYKVGLLFAAEVRDEPIGHAVIVNDHAVAAELPEELPLGLSRG